MMEKYLLNRFYSTDIIKTNLQYKYQLAPSVSSSGSGSERQIQR